MKTSIIAFNDIIINISEIIYMNKCNNDSYIIYMKNGMYLTLNKKDVEILVNKINDYS